MGVHVNIEQVREIFYKFRELYLESEEYVNTIPSDIRSAFFDNPSSNAKTLLIDYLAKQLLGEELYEELAYWVYERYCEYPFSIFIEDQEFVMTNDDTYFKWIEEFYKEQLK